MPHAGSSVAPARPVAAAAGRPPVLSPEESIGVFWGGSDVWRRSPQELVRLWDVRTGINIPEFRRLSVGCNEGERVYVLDGLLHGFPLGINRAGPFPPRRLWAESKVSTAGRVRITDYFVRPAGDKEKRSVSECFNGNKEHAF